MASIVVSEYTGSNKNGASGMGLLDPKVHATPEAAAKDILERQQRTRDTIDANKRYGSNIGTTNIEVHSTNASPGAQINANHISSIKPDVLQQIKGHVSKGLAGLALAGAVGIAAAAEPGATPTSVGNAVADTAIPGWAAARQGQACKAFGDATGYITSGLTIAAGATATTTVAIGVGGLSGPLAPVTAGAVAVGGSALTVKAADAAYEAGSTLGESACGTVASGVNKAKTIFGFGGS